MEATERISPRTRGGVRTISLDEIDWDYERKGRVLGGDNPKKRAYFGQDTIGPLGVALALHRRLWLDNRAMTADAFGDALSNYIPQDLTRENFERRHLRAWVQASKFVALPDPAHAERALKALQSLARDSGLDEPAVLALTGKWKRPSELLARLRGDHDTSWGPDFHPIEPLFFSERIDRDSPLGLLSKQLGDLFVGDIGKDNIVALVGPRYSGKRRVISDLIQNKVRDESYLELASGERVRIFGRNAEGTPFEEIIHDVAVFLGVDVPNGQSPISLTDTLLKNISEKARRRENFSAYIFADVPIAENPLGQMLANEQFQRLIEALSPRNNSGNRLLLSGTRIDLAVDRYDDVVSIPIPLPSLQQIGKAYDLPVEPDWAGSTEVDGPFSALLSILLDRAWGDDQLKEARTVALEASHHLAHEASIKNACISDRLDLIVLAKAICRRLENEGSALNILKFVALSEDGVRLRSLKRLLGFKNCLGGSADDPTTKGLEVLSSRLQPIYRQIDNSGPYTNDDPPGDTTEYEPRFELLPPFRRIFEHVFYLGKNRDDHQKQEFSCHNWAIAELALDQARWRRLRDQSYYGTMPSDVVRNAQALQRAQIAIEPDGLRKGCATRPVRGQSTLPANIDSRNAFRFLFFDLFRDDIDLQNRLSLQYQRDDLRLNLLMGFCNLGRPFYFDESPPSADYFSSWEALRYVLSDTDKAKLLVSIAITAKRTGVWRIVLAALQKAEEMAREGKIRHWMIERIYRCEIDTAILKCGSLQERYKTLKDIEALIDHRLRQLSDEAKDVANEEFGATANWSARVKLLARRGEVLTLQGNLSEAFEAFQEAERIQRSGLQKAAGQLKWRTSPLLGHGARRFLRVLCEMARQSDDEGQRNDLLVRAQQLYETNLKRLSRFSGHTSMFALDQSWIFLLQGEFSRSRTLLLELPDPPWAALTSVSERIEIDSSYSSLGLDLIEIDTSDKDCDALAQRTKNSLGRLLRVARRADLPLHRAFGEVMGIRWLGLVGRLLQATKVEGQSMQELLRSAENTIASTGYRLLLPRISAGYMKASEEQLVF